MLGIGRPTLEHYCQIFREGGAGGASAREHSDSGSHRAALDGVRMLRDHEASVCATVRVSGRVLDLNHGSRMQAQSGFR